jgi:hypothetical protein
MSKICVIIWMLVAPGQDTSGAQVIESKRVGRVSKAKKNKAKSKLQNECINSVFDKHLISLTDAKT